MLSHLAKQVIAVSPAGRATLSAGIVILGAAVDMIIRGNRITDARNGGISLLRTRRVSIVDNRVAPGRGDPAMVFGNGICLTRPLDGGGDVLIQNNTVVCDNPNADGILIGGFTAPVSGAIRSILAAYHGSVSTPADRQCWKARAQAPRGRTKRVNRSFASSSPLVQQIVQ